MDRDDLAKRNVLDGDSFMGTSPSFRFSKPETEPYMPNLTEGACVGGGGGGGASGMRAWARGGFSLVSLGARCCLHV